MFILPVGLSGIPELFLGGPETTVKALLLLGYPLYLMKILGFAKILGSIGIITGKIPRMKEWAYAGFTFNLLGATASHLLAGDGAHAPIPFVFFLIMLGSYAYWHKTPSDA